MGNEMLKKFMRKLSKLDKKDYDVSYFFIPIWDGVGDSEGLGHGLGFNVILNDCYYYENKKVYKIGFGDGDNVENFREWVVEHCDEIHHEDDGGETTQYRFVEAGFMVRLSYLSNL